MCAKSHPISFETQPAVTGRGKKDCACRSKREQSCAEELDEGSGGGGWTGRKGSETKKKNGPSCQADVAFFDNIGNCHARMLLASSVPCWHNARCVKTSTSGVPFVLSQLNFVFKAKCVSFYNALPHMNSSLFFGEYVNILSGFKSTSRIFRISWHIFSLLRSLLRIFAWESRN